LTQTDCNDANIGALQLNWLDDPGLCADVTIGNYQLCLASGAGQSAWWPGSALLDDTLMTKESCDSVGFCAPSYDFIDQVRAIFFLLQSTDALKDSCLSTFYCDGCSMCDQYNCTSTGTCSNRVGCHLPFTSSGDCYTGELWTPEGCFDNEMNQTDCIVEDGSWIDTQQRSANECRRAGSVCVEGTYTESFNHNRPGSVTFKNESECTKCNARYESVYSFRAVSLP
jgi:hypothetical protein